MVFFAVLLALGVGLYRDYGISWDEPHQRFTGAVTVKHLAERFAPSLVKGEVLRLPPLDTYVDRDHGTAFEMPAVALEALLKLSDKRDIFMMRHLLTFLVCFAGTVAVYAMATRRFGDWRSGLLAALLLVLSPRLFAESFYNSKDAVFMAAFAIAMSTAIAFLLRPGPATAVLHGLATAFAIDIRVMAVILPVVSLSVLALRLVRREVPVGRALRASAIHLAATIAFAVAMWVWLWSNPLANFAEAFASMAQFRWQGDTLYLGAVVPGRELPWHYIPVWLSLTTPPFYLALFGVGTLAILVRFASRRLALWQTDEELQDLFFLGLVIAPVVAVIGLQSVLYGGWRHLYFIYPAFLLVAVRGWQVIWSSAKVWRPLRPAFAAVTALLLLLVAAWMVRAHPLQNVYFNAFAGRDLRARFDVDYWGLANRQALEYILKHDSSPVITIVADSETPLESAIDMIEPAERGRLRMAGDGETARYLLTNFHGDRQTDETRRARGYLPFREIAVDGEPVLAIFRHASAF